MQSCQATYLYLATIFTICSFLVPKQMQTKLRSTKAFSRSSLGSPRCLLCNPSCCEMVEQLPWQFPAKQLCKSHDILNLISTYLDNDYIACVAFTLCEQVATKVCSPWPWPYWRSVAAQWAELLMPTPDSTSLQKGALSFGNVELCYPMFLCKFHLQNSCGLAELCFCWCLLLLHEWMALLLQQKNHVSSFTCQLVRGQGRACSSGWLPLK